jgi:hypothetical protein
MTNKKARELRVKKQLEDWVKGKSVHNEIDDECCPDFACCNPASAVSLEKRQEFFNANEKGREKMLVGFLASAFETLGVKAEVSAR